MPRPPSQADPLVSVLLPVRDAEATLPATLRSLLRQRETRWECVAVDDGSTDGSAALLRAAAGADARIHVLSTARRGLVSALAAGLPRCRAPFVARMDGDDWMHRDRLAAQLAALGAHPEWSAVGAHVRMFPRAALTDGRRRYEAWLNGIRTAEDVHRERFVECPIAHPSLMIRTGVLRAFGYRARGWPEDYDLLLRLCAAGHTLGVVPQRLLGWRDSAGRLSRRAPEYGLDRFTACKARHLADGPLAATRRYVLWGYGSTGRALRRALLAHERSPSCIVELHPGRLGQRIHGAPVIAPEQLAARPREPIVVSVAGATPRTRIRRALSGMGLREGIDFYCAA